MRPAYRNVTKWFAHLSCAVPLALLVVDIVGNRLGPDPAESVVRTLGLWGISLLWGCLAMTPLRLLTGKPLWIAFRRMLGLWAFAYITLHLTAFFLFWSGASVAVVMEELVKHTKDQKSIGPALDNLAQACLRHCAAGHGASGLD